MKTRCARWSGPPGALLVYTCSRNPPLSRPIAHTTPLTRLSFPHPMVLYIFIIIIIIIAVVVVCSSLGPPLHARTSAAAAISRARSFRPRPGTRSYTNDDHLARHRYTSGGSCLANNNIVIKTGRIIIIMMMTTTTNKKNALCGHTLASSCDYYNDNSSAAAAVSASPVAHLSRCS